MSIPRLAKNKLGNYEIRWTEGRRSHRLSTRTSDPQEAQLALAAFIREQEREEEAESLTVPVILEQYRAEHVPSCADSRRQHTILDFLSAFCAGMFPSDLDAPTMAKYCASRGVANGTLRREICVLKAALNHAVKQRRILPHSFPHIVLPPSAQPKDLVLSVAEIDTLVDCSKQWPAAYRLILLLSETASRRRAVETLKWEHVDLDTGLIHYGAEDERKTNKRRVPVPISDKLRAMLEADPQTRTFVVSNGRQTSYLFKLACKKAYKQTQNPKYLEATPHTLRHSWATNAAQAGVPLYQIAGVLGDTLATVTANYLHHCPDHLRSAVNFRAAS